MDKTLTQYYYIYCYIETSLNLPLTVDQLLPILLPCASKWQSLGKALSLDEDRLDEIFTNNETNEACLQEMLELYFKRSDLKHSREEIYAAHTKLEGESLNVIKTTSDIWTQPDGMESVIYKVTSAGK